jgi:hypothetical protein
VDLRSSAPSRSAAMRAVILGKFFLDVVAPEIVSSSSI